MNEVHLSDESVERIAQRVFELLRSETAPPFVANSDPWLTHKQAAAYLAMSASTFDRARKAYPDALKPAMEHPLRWSRNALDVFKLTKGAPLHHRPGRKPKAAHTSQV